MHIPGATCKAVDATHVADKAVGVCRASHPDPSLQLTGEAPTCAHVTCPCSSPIVLLQLVLEAHKIVKSDMARVWGIVISEITSR